VYKHSYKFIKQKTICLRSPIFSPLSQGSANPITTNTVIKAQGNTKLKLWNSRIHDSNKKTDLLDLVPLGFGV